MITRINKGHADEAARIHLNSLPGDFLPSLGIGFLKVFYEGLIPNPSIFGFVVLDGDTIRGFIIGAENMESVFKSVIATQFFKLSRKILLSLLKNPFIL